MNVFQNESKVKQFILLFKMSFVTLYGILGFPDVSVVKNLPANAGDEGDMGLIPGQEFPLEEEITTHSSILARRVL